LRQPLREPILFLVLSVLVDSNVTVRYWRHLDGVLPVSAIFALVLASANGMILSHVNDVKVGLNVSVIFLFWTGIVQNVSCWNVHVIRLFVLSVFRSMNANASLIANASMIVIKLTNRDAADKS
jgi:hypothetical protein